ncbi:TPA: hypothetical protein ACWLUJ_005766 [Pseudomonas aeruginosa]|nr:hypothetical protein [Pseudomonas aeruginosa]
MKQLIEKTNPEQRRVERLLLLVSIVCIITPCAVVAVCIGIRAYAGIPLWTWMESPFLTIGACGMVLMGGFTARKLMSIRRTGTGWQDW